jgi:hypothetical protein
MSDPVIELVKQARENLRRRVRIALALAYEKDDALRSLTQACIDHDVELAAIVKEDTP